MELRNKLKRKIRWMDSIRQDMTEKRLLSGEGAKTGLR